MKNHHFFKGLFGELYGEALPGSRRAGLPCDSRLSPEEFIVINGWTKRKSSKSRRRYNHQLISAIQGQPHPLGIGLERSFGGIIEKSYIAVNGNLA